MKLTLRKKSEQPEHEGKMLCAQKSPAVWLHIIVFFVLLIGGLIPQMQRMQDLGQTVQETESQSFQAAQLKLNSMKAEEAFAEFDGQELLAATLPPEENIITFVETFENAAAENTVVHNLELNTEGREESAGVITIPVTLQVTGSLGYAVQFLTDIEKQDFYMNISSISVGNDIASTDQVLLLEGETYWSNEQQ